MAEAHEYVSFALLIGETHTTRYFHSEGRTESDMSLSLFIGPRFFQYAIFGPGSKEALELCDVDHTGREPGIAGDQLDILFQNYSLAGTRFRKTNVAVLHHHFVMLPSSFAAQADLAGVLSFTGASPQEGSTMRHQMREFEFCFRTDSLLVQTLERAFSNCSVRHAGAVSILGFTSSASLSGCSAFLNVHTGMIEIALRRDGTVVFYNTFAVSGDEDVLYYLLFSAEQFLMKPDEITLGIAGQADENGQLVKYLRRYCGGIQFVSNDPTVQLAGRLRDLDPHRYFTLLNQHLCEL